MGRLRKGLERIVGTLLLGATLFNGGAFVAKAQSAPVEENIRVNLGDSSELAEIRFGTIEHKDGSAEGIDARDTSWSGFLPTQYQYAFQISTTVDGTRLKRDSRPLTSQTVFDSTLSVTNKNGSSNVQFTGNVMYFEVPSQDPNRNHLAGIKIFKEVFGGTQDFYTVTNIADWSTGGPVVSLPDFSLTIPAGTEQNVGNAKFSTEFKIQELAGTEDVQIVRDLSLYAPEQMTFQIAVAPTNSVAGITNSVLTVTPNPDYNGADYLKYNLLFNGQVMGDVAFNINYSPVNDNPVISGNNSFDLDEDGSSVQTYTASDVDGDTVTLSVSQNPTYGTLVQNGNNFTYNPFADYNGSDTYTIRASDGNGGLADKVVNVTVNPINDAPTANNQNLPLNEDGNKTLTLTGTDVDNDSLTFRVVSNPIHGALSGTLPNLTYTPNPDYNGSDSFTFVANDGTVDSAPATVSFDIAGVNDAPTINNPLGQQSGTYGSPFNTTVPSNTFFDKEVAAGQQTLTLSAYNLPSGISFSNGEFSGTPTSAGTYEIELVATDNGTPALSVTNNVTMNFAKAPLNVRAGSDTREYGLNNPDTSYTLEGFVLGDTEASSVTGSPTVNINANPASPVSGSPYTIAISQGSLSSQNYSFTFINGQLVVTKAPLTINVGSTNSVYGSPINTFNVDILGLRNGDTVTGAGITAATPSSDVGGYDTDATLEDIAGVLPNYQENKVKGTYTITPAPLTVSADPAQREYGNENPGFNVSVSGGVNGDTFTKNATTTATLSSNVGQYTITPSISGAKIGNYNVTLQGSTLTINPAILTGDIVDATREYGLNNPSFTFNLSGFKLGQGMEVVSGSPEFTTDAQVNSSIGDYTITVSSLGNLNAPNYVFSFPSVTSDAVLHITKAPAPQVTLSQNSINTIYGDGFVVPTVNVTGLRVGDETNVTFNVNAPAQNSNAGSYQITVQSVDEQNKLNNYNSIVLPTAILDINKATLNVNLNNTPLTKEYGDLLAQSPTYQITGFKLGQNSSVISGSPTITTTASSLEAIVGNHPINIEAGNLTAQNYVFNVVSNPNNDFVSVTPAPLTITAGNGSSEYGEPINSINVSFNGLKNGGDSIVGNGITTATQSSNAGNHTTSSVLSDPQNKLPNYNVTYINGTYTITPANLYGDIVDVEREYGENNPNFNITFTGFKLSDNPSIVTGAPTYQTDATQSSNAGDYAIRVTSSGTLATSNNNYTFVFLPETSEGVLRVTKAPLNVSLSQNPLVKEYGEALGNPTFTFTGFKLDDNVDDISGMPGFSSPAQSLDANVGMHGTTIIQENLASPNYTFTFQQDGQVQVNPANLTTTAQPTAREYGLANPAFTYQITGFKLGQNSSVISGSPNLETTATLSSNIGQYPITITQGSLSAQNYIFGNFVNNALTINRAPAPQVTLSQNSINTIYGDGFVVPTVNVTGLRAGDETNVTFNVNAPAQNADAGNHQINVQAGGLVDRLNNYDSFTLPTASLNINKADLTATAQPTAREYGLANPPFIVDVSGARFSDTFTTSASTAALIDSNVGFYVINPEVSGDKINNYNVQKLSGSLEVTKAPKPQISLSQNNVTVIYGDAFTLPNVQVNGLRAGDETNVTFTATTTAQQGSGVGSHQINVDADDPRERLSNYVSLTSEDLPNATVTITPAELSARAFPSSTVYGDNPAFNAFFSGAKMNDGQSLTMTLNAAPSPIKNVGTYTLTPQVNGPAGVLQNYTLNVTSSTHTVTPAPLTLNALPTQSTYGGTPVFNGEIVGAKFPEDLGAMTLTFSTAPSPIKNVGTYTLTPGVTGNQEVLQNYFVQEANTSTHNVTQASLIVQADRIDRLYGQSNGTFTYSLEGLVAGDNSSAVSGSPNMNTTATPASPVSGSPYTITISSGNMDSQNYTLTFRNGELYVHPASLLIKADNKSRTFSQENPLLTATYNGFVNGESPANLLKPVNLSTDAMTRSPAGQYTIFVGGADSRNYTLSYQNGSMMILPDMQQPRITAIQYTGTNVLLSADIYTASRTNQIKVTPFCFSDLQSGNRAPLTNNTLLVTPDGVSAWTNVTLTLPTNGSIGFFNLGVDENLDN